MAESETGRDGAQPAWGERNINDYLPGQSYSPELIRERDNLQEQLNSSDESLRDIDRQFSELRNLSNDDTRARLERELEARYNQINDYRGGILRELRVVSEGLDPAGWETADEESDAVSVDEAAVAEESEVEPEAVTEPELAETREEEVTPSEDPTEPATTVPTLRGEEPREPAVPEVVPRPTPEKVNDYHRRAINEINALCIEQNSVAQERYRGILGPVRRWFDSVGNRRQAQTLEKAGEWKDNAKWKKWAKIGLKVGGGFGLAAAMTFTGGAGAILTPLLWTMGAREGFDGALQLAEQAGWGGKRAKSELETQRKVSQEVEALKGLVQERGKELSEAEYAEAAQRMIEAAGKATEKQMGNMRSERKWALFRSITSTILSVGAGAIAGVPLGTASYAKEATGHATQVGQTALDNAHQVFINYRGGQFLYNDPSEMMRVAAEVSKHGYDWTVNSESYLRASHMLGGGLPLAEKVGLGLSGTYLLGRILEQFVGRKGRKEGPPSSPYSPYSPYSPGSPRPPYSPDRRGGSATRELSVDEGLEGESPSSEKEKVKTYLEEQDGEYLKELEGFAEKVPAMDKECRMAVCIPVACTESERIYNTLEKYLGQTDSEGNPLESNSFEINLFVNGPSDRVEEINKTAEEVKRFQSDHPEVKVNLVEKAFEEKTNIGEIRKYVNDLAVLRGAKREEQDGELYLVLNDADCEAIDKDYLSALRNELDSNPNLVAVSTKEDFKSEDMNKYPLLRASRRLSHFYNAIMASPRYSPDPRLMMFYTCRAGKYAEVGGFDKNDWVAEDLKLGLKLIESSPYGRASTKQIHQKYTTSARRYISALERGEPVMNSYNEFGIDEEFRKKEHHKPIKLAEITPDRPRQFVSALEVQAADMYASAWNRFFWPEFDRNPDVVAARAAGDKKKVSQLEAKLRASGVGHKAEAAASRVFDKLMGFWGVDRYGVRIDKSGSFKVRIKGWGQLKQGLQNPL